MTGLLESPHLNGATSLSPERVRELTSGLETERQALQSFTVAMEQEFMELGEMLRKVTLLTRAARDRSDEVMAAATGRAEDAAIQFTFQLLKKAEDLVVASREQFHTVVVVFEQIHADVSRIAHQRGMFMSTISPLEMTNIQLRIQACAFDEGTRAKFFGLADTIRGIIREVSTAVERRFEDLELAATATGTMVAKLASMATEQRAGTERMLLESRDSLSRLNEVLLSSEATAQSISETGARIAGGVGKAIVALQCQDMARQKFQHIEAAIDSVVAHLSAGSVEGFRDAAEADCRHFLADAGRVQLRQLHAVFQQLQEAASQVSGGLVEIDAGAKALAGHALQSGTATLDGRVIGQAIESIHAVLLVIENAVMSVRNVVDLVQKLKATFNDCTSHVLELALDLRLVALNAQIFAAQVEAGASLEVVASNTRMVADEAMKQLSGISSGATEMIDAVTDLEQRLIDYRELATLERDQLSLESAESETKLRTLEQDLRVALSAIGSLDGELSETIRRMTQSIRFPEAVAEASARSTALFDRIAVQYSDSDDDAKETWHQKVEELKSNYTMAHERAVHEWVVEPASAEPAQPVNSEPLEERLADNVELF